MGRGDHLLHAEQRIEPELEVPLGPVGDRDGDGLRAELGLDEVDAAVRAAKEALTGDPLLGKGPVTLVEPRRLITLLYIRANGCGLNQSFPKSSRTQASSWPAPSPA